MQGCKKWRKFFERWEKASGIFRLRAFIKLVQFKEELKKKCCRKSFGV